MVTTSVFYIYGSLYANNHSYPKNSIIKGFPAFSHSWDVFISRQKIYKHLTTGKALSPRWPPMTPKEGNCYE